MTSDSKWRGGSEAPPATPPPRALAEVSAERFLLTKNKRKKFPITLGASGDKSAWIVPSGPFKV